MLKSQSIFNLEILAYDSLDAEEVSALVKQISYQKSFLSFRGLQNELEKFLLKLYDNAYLAATFDSLGSDSLNLKAFLRLGKPYKWANLSKGNVEEAVLSEVGFREKIYANKAFYFKEVRKFLEKLLQYYENNGFPFASVKLDSIVIKDNIISAQILSLKNTEILVDSISIKGKAKISKAYLYNYLNIKPKSAYKENIIRNISIRIREIPFLKEVKPFNVVFNEKNAHVLLFLENKKASQLDGIIGILPDQEQDGKILFTGEAHLKLQNSLEHGEILELTWKKLQINTQDLKVKVIYPFLFSTPFGLDFNFILFKQDTTYINIISDIGVQYLLPGNNYFKGFVKTKKSSLLSTANLENLTVLPPYADINSIFYGISYKMEKLDYRLNPRKGYLFEITAAAGNKHVKQNPNIDSELYDGINLNTVEYNTDCGLDFFLPIRNRSTFNIGLKGALLESPTIFKNDLFRMGGLKSLRGFDEESIYASSYSILKLEYRLLLEQNSYLFIFWNGAYYENKKDFIYDTPWGFGTGVSFETKLGVFSFTYALGTQLGNPIEIRSGKIHFGIVNFF